MALFTKKPSAPIQAELHAAETGNSRAGGMREMIEAQAKHQPVGEKELQKAMETLHRYKSGKENLNARIIDNEQWWKLRHWESMRKGGDDNPKPTSGWLVNVCMSKHADAMDAYPEPNILPRELNDREEAHILSSIIPVIHQQNDFEGTWSDAWWKKIKAGFSVYGVFWDGKKLNGLGDIVTKEVDPLNLYWEPGIMDIQDSPHLFFIQTVSNEVLQMQYPQLTGKLGPKTMNTAEYLYDDSVSTDDKSAVVDWYYKKNGLLHYCKFVRNEILYASENDGELIKNGAQHGFYDHGEYPFVMDVMFPEEGTPAGFGYIDLCKDAQEQIDLMNNAFIMNTLYAATPRWFKKVGSSINEAQFMDVRNPFVDVTGNVDDNALRPISVNSLGSAHLACLDRKVEEMKETSGNRDVSNGGTTAGVTAASAIAAMQEQSGKLSRDQIQNSYRSFRKVVYLEIELIRQFYNGARKFRITGAQGQEDFVTYRNSGLQMQPLNVAGENIGMRLPVFDIEVLAQKSNAYSKMSQNELAIQLFNMGFFNPQLTDQALACVDLMEFRGKQSVVQKITKNATLSQKLQQTQMLLVNALQELDRLRGTNTAEVYVAQQSGQPAPAMPEKTAGGEMLETNTLGEPQKKEHAKVEKAREQAQTATQPR